MLPSPIKLCFVGKTEKKGKQMYASLWKECQQVTYPGVMLDAI